MKEVEELSKGQPNTLNTTKETHCSWQPFQKQNKTKQKTKNKKKQKVSISSLKPYINQNKAFLEEGEERKGKEREAKGKGS